MDNSSETHTFHAATDDDWYVVNGLTPGASYNVSTFGLTGGADTYMILYDQNNNIVRSNDDEYHDCAR